MQTNLVKNTHLLNVGFNSNRKLENYSSFVNMDDSQLKLLAQAKAFDKEENKRNRKDIFKMICAIPIVDSISRGLMAGAINNIERPALSKILSTAGKTAGSWALILSLFALYQSAESKISANNPPLQKFKKEHPLLDFVADCSIILAGLALCRKGFDAIKTNSKLTNSRIFIKASEVIKNAKTGLNATAFNKTILPKVYELIETFAKAAPSAHKAGKALIYCAVPILFVSAVAKTVLYSKSQAEKVRQNYIDLKNKQFKAARHLSNALGVERDILAQEQPELAKELREVMNRVEPK